jgi:hypothetical protein
VILQLSELHFSELYSSDNKAQKRVQCLSLNVLQSLTVLKFFINLSLGLSFPFFFSVFKYLLLESHALPSNHCIVTFVKTLPAFSSTKKKTKNCFRNVEK